MSRKFRVTIGGITYNVEVEEIGGGAAAPAAAPAPAQAPVRVAAPAAAPAPAPAPAPAAPAPAAAKAAAPTAGGEVIKAPLPGMVAAVRVEVGQTVTPGQVVLVLEAMKMENDITAPVGGTVKEVLVQKGTAVSLHDPLVVIG